MLFQTSYYDNDNDLWQSSLHLFHLRTGSTVLILSLHFGLSSVYLSDSPICTMFFLYFSKYLGPVITVWRFL